MNMTPDDSELESVEIIDDLLIYIKMHRGGTLPEYDNGIDAALRFLAKSHKTGHVITMSLANILRERGLLPDDQR